MLVSVLVGLSVVAVFLVGAQWGAVVVACQNCVSVGVGDVVGQGYTVIVGD